MGHQQQVVYQEPVVVQEPVRYVSRVQEPVVHHQPRVVSHRQEEPKQWSSSNVNEYKTYVGEGERVLVETRTYSPNREPRIETHAHEDWARYSQAHWREHMH